MKRIAILTLLVLAASTLSMPTLAENKKPNPEREQIRRLQQAQQKVEQEKASLQLEKSAVEEQLKASAEKLENVQKSLQVSVQRSSQQAVLQASKISALEQDKSALNTRLLESEKRVAQLDETQRKSAAENVRLQAILSKQAQELAASEAKNVQLYKYSVDLLEKYKSKGVWTSLAQTDPLTGLKRVEIENLLDEYRDKLDTQKVEPVNR